MALHAERDDGEATLAASERRGAPVRAVSTQAICLVTPRCILTDCHVCSWLSKNTTTPLAPARVMHDTNFHADNIITPPPSNPDGRYHLPPTHSPEFMKGPGDGDTSYELAISRWGFGAALRLASELGMQDARTAVWQERYENLANYSIDPVRGLNVAKNLPFDVPHRYIHKQRLIACDFGVHSV